MGSLCPGERNVPGSQEMTVGVRETTKGVREAKQDTLKLESQQRKICANTSPSPVTCQN